MTEYYFYLNLTYEDCMDYYHGYVKFIQVVEDGGKRVRFPAVHIRRFVSSLGVRGRFRLCLNPDNSFMSLEKVA